MCEKSYWNPSQELARKIGAKLTITKGQFYDACIQHGTDGKNGCQEMIDATTKAMGGTPKTGIDETKWLVKFLDARKKVLLASDKEWQESVDRVECYRRILKTGNTSLTTPLNITAYGDKYTIK